MKNQHSFILISLILFTFIYLCSCKDFTGNEEGSIQKKDSISQLIKLSKNKSFDTNQQKKYLIKAYDFLKSKPRDTLKARDLSLIAYRFYQLKDTIQFKRINEECLSLAIQLKDYYTIADANWSYADFYQFREIYTSSYYYYDIALKNFKKTTKRFETARMLSQMAFIKGRFRDYTGSETLLIEAIKIYKELNLTNNLYHSYNSLALLQNDIKEYDRSIFYHQKALEYLRKVKKPKNYKAGSLNNIGLTYLQKGEYSKAIAYFNKALMINKKKISSYARYMDNRAYARLKLGDTTNVEKDLLRALFIRDSLNIKGGIVFSKIRISKYYSFIKDSIKALKFAKEANELAQETKNGIDYLESLKLLADLQPNKAKAYLERHIEYNDSLLNVERKVKNNLNRIEMETDEFIEDNKRLSQQNIWITVVGLAILLISSLLYFIRVQKVKTEKLLLETEQQKANEQVYLLTLKQQAILEEEKVKERNRISEELHDGILGRLFGTRVGLGFLDLQADEDTQEQHQSFLEELQDIEKEIRDVSHKLNDNFNSSEINFTTIIGQLIKDKSALGGFTSALQIDKNIAWDHINELVKVNVYRIVQESLQNIIKHAEAKNIALNFSTTDEQLSVQLKDDGKGFNIKKNKKGIGMKNMKSRIQKLNGTIDFISEKGKGTSIHIKIPIS